jgi:hypothetical protein
MNKSFCFRKDGTANCSKFFPKEFCSDTEWNENAFYPKYRRRSPEDGGRSIHLPNGKVVDNRWVVPYCPYLTLRYEAHINTEVCISSTATKYPVKYVSKGPDRAIALIGHNEVEDFKNYRSIGASKSCWRLLQLDITDRYPAVMALIIHLPGEEYVIFEEGQEEATAAQGSKETELTVFSYNAAHPGILTTYATFHVTLSCLVCDGMDDGTNWHDTPAKRDTYLQILLGNDHFEGVTSFNYPLRVNGEMCISWYGGEQG